MSCMELYKLHAMQEARLGAALNEDDFIWLVVGDAEQVMSQLEPLGLPIEVRELPSDE